MMTRLFSITLVAFIFSLYGQAFGQFVTPSLDPTFETGYPAATAWRYSSGVAGGYNSTTGELDSTDEDKEITIGVSMALFAFKGEQLALEGQYYSMNETTDGTDSNGNYDLKIDTAGYQLYASYLLGENVSIGIGQDSRGYEMKYTPSGISVAQKETTSTQTVSASVRLGNAFFLAAGIGNAKKDGHGKLEVDAMPSMNYDSDLVENSWTEIGYGLAILTGGPGEFQFRLEVFSSSSPESKKSADGAKRASYHQKSDTLYAAIELKTENYLITYQSITEKQAELTQDDGDTSYETIETDGNLGIGYVPENGLNIMFYASQGVNKEKRSSADYETKSTSYAVTLGYTF